MKTAVFGLYGESDSGKTTLIVRIIKQLCKDGFKVASVKISNKKIRIDGREKDTWKHARAGSRLVVLSSLDETDFLLKKHQSISEILKQIDNIEQYDLIIVEGANDKRTPKIRLGNIKERKNTILTYRGDFEKLIEMIKKEILTRKNMKKISIKVNGKQVPLTDFPEEIIKNTICGMLKSLKGVDEDIEHIEITF